MTIVSAAEEEACSDVSSGRAALVLMVWIWVSISWMSKRTFDSGVERSMGVSEGLLVDSTRELANVVGEKSGERKVS